MNSTSRLRHLIDHTRGSAKRHGAERQRCTGGHDRERINGLLCAVLSVALLLLSSSARAATLKPAAIDRLIPDRFTTVFRYDENSFGILDPSRGEILILASDGTSEKTVALQQTSATPTLHRAPATTIPFPDARFSATPGVSLDKSP